MAAFDNKDPEEIEIVGFDFAQRLAAGETIQTATFTVVVLSGTDASPSSVLQGSPIIDGSIAKHMIKSGVASVVYRITAKITTSLGQTMVEAGNISVTEIG